MGILQTKETEVPFTDLASILEWSKTMSLSCLGALQGAELRPWLPVNLVRPSPLQVHLILISILGLWLMSQLTLY